MQATHIQQILMRGRWFSNISPSLQNALLTHGVLKQLKDGQTLFSRGDGTDGIYGLLKGTMQVIGKGKNSPEDKMVILTLIEPPDWIGEICLFDKQPRTHDTIADGPVTLLHIKQQTLDQLVQDNPTYWREFGLLVTQKIRLIFGAIEDAALLPTPVRVARRLLQMAEGYGIRSDSGLLTARTLHVSQDKLSAMLSVSRQTINQVLKELEGDGAIDLKRGRMEIVDLTRLKQRAQLG